MNAQRKDTSWLKQIPIAHRGLHDSSLGIWENSESAIKAAAQAGYAIEFDLQPSVDHVPMVFHDLTLDRMTDQGGEVRGLAADQLTQLHLKDSQDTIWRFSRLLEIVDGAVPLVVELKGNPPNDAGFAAAVGKALEHYSGAAAVMSFDHQLLRDCRREMPDLPVGLTAEGDDVTYQTHRHITDELELDFISYHHKNLETQFVKEFAASGKPVICWTIKDQAAADQAYRLCDQITFEGFIPKQQPLS